MNQSSPLRLEILTPTFIGNGNKLLPIEVYIEGKTAKVFKFDNLTKQVAKIFPPEKLKNLMLKLAGEVSSKSLNGLLKELNLSVDKLKPDYTLEVEGEFKPSEVEEFIKTLKGVYIPGSEIKGAFRTAIFYHILITYNRFWERFMDEFRWFIKRYNPDKDKGVFKSFAQHWENKIFAGKPLKEDFKGRESPKGREDVLKFLQVEDSETKDPSEVLKFSHLRNSKKQFPVWVESLKENSTFGFKIRWNSEGAQQFIETYLKGMERELKEFWETLNEEKLLKITDRFTRDLITFEEAKREGNGASYRKTPTPKGGDYLEILERLKREVLKGETTRRDTKTLGKLKEEKGYLIRLGKFTGRLTHSILLAVYRKDRKFFESTVKRKFKHKTYWEDEKGNPLGFGKLIPA